MELANALQNEMIRRLGIVDAEAQYTANDVGVFYHAWLGQAKAKHVYVVHAKNQMTQDNVAAALTHCDNKYREPGVKRPSREPGRARESPDREPGQ
jgi:hypothetical protein